MKRALFALSVCRLPSLVGVVAVDAAPAAPDPAKVDAVFARWTSKTPGCAVGCRAGRQGGAREGLRHGRPRARRPERRGHDLRGRLGVEAVHGRGRPAAGARRQAVARRPGAEVRPRTPRLRQAADDPPPAHAHERPSRLGRDRGDRRVAPHVPGLHPRPRPRHRLAAEVAELRAWNVVVLLQHRLQPGRHHRVARERRALRRVLPDAHLRAAGDDAHLVARRLPPNREGARDRLQRNQGHLPAEHAVRERPRQRRPADDGRRPAEVERERRDAEGR